MYRIARTVEEKAPGRTRMNVLKTTAAVFAALIFAYLVVGTAKVLRWNAQSWLPKYMSDELSKAAQARTAPKHIIFTMVDHYEPGAEEAEAVERNGRWLAAYDDIAVVHRDSTGTPFRYTWFYPYDQPHGRVMERLSESVYRGLGEIEFHWHHPKSDNGHFPAQVQEAVAWFNRYGALVSSTEPRVPQFAFVHGNWALDGSHERCGVTNEIAILQRYGGYMDMTFSTIGSTSQPTRKLNSLYYVVDDEQPRSYEEGQDVTVGKVVDGAFLMFQGPLSLSWNLALEYGAVESYALPSRERIRRWIDAGIHVQGNPQWVFVKVYSHGIQSEVIVHEHLDRMLTELEEEAASIGAQLHYMTAREAYNVVKAAEAGHSDDPSYYRDFVIPKPLNAVQTMARIRAEGTRIANGSAESNEAGGA